MMQRLIELLLHLPFDIFIQIKTFAYIRKSIQQTLAFQENAPHFTFWIAMLSMAAMSDISIDKIFSIEPFRLLFDELKDFFKKISLVKSKACSDDLLSIIIKMLPDRDYEELIGRLDILINIRETLYPRDHILFCLTTLLSSMHQKQMMQFNPSLIKEDDFAEPSEIEKESLYFEEINRIAAELLKEEEKLSQNKKALKCIEWVVDLETFQKIEDTVQLFKQMCDTVDNIDEYKITYPIYFKALASFVTHLDPEKKSQGCFKTACINYAYIHKILADVEMKQIRQASSDNKGFSSKFYFFKNYFIKAPPVSPTHIKTVSTKKI